MAREERNALFQITEALTGLRLTDPFNFPRIYVNGPDVYRSRIDAPIKKTRLPCSNFGIAEDDEPSAH